MPIQALVTFLWLIPRMVNCTSFLFAAIIMSKLLSCSSRFCAGGCDWQ